VSVYSLVVELESWRAAMWVSVSVVKMVGSKARPMDVKMAQQMGVRMDNYVVIEMVLMMVEMMAD